MTAETCIDECVTGTGGFRPHCSDNAVILMSSVLGIDRQRAITLSDRPAAMKKETVNFKEYASEWRASY